MKVTRKTATDPRRSAKAKSTIRTTVSDVKGLIPAFMTFTAARGKAKAVSPDGVESYIDTNVISDADAETFLTQGLSSTDVQVSGFSLARHSDLVLDYAVYAALMAQSLSERGREVAYSDNGVHLTPPDVSNMCFSVAQSHLNTWQRKIELLRHQ